MAKIGKLLETLRKNPKADWQIEDLKKLARRYEIDYKQSSGSHVTFRTPNTEKLTVPAHKPIKPIYIKMFIEFIEKTQKVKVLKND